MKNISVTVIIPVKNSVAYFKQCLDSVQMQTLNNIEIIIIDDSSTDGSGEVADLYKYNDCRVKVIHNKFSIGAGESRNIAIKISNGEYIAFIDSDDVYPSSNILEMLYNKAKEKNADICGGSLFKIDSEGNVINREIPDQFFINEGWYCYKNYQYEGGFYRFLYRRKFIKEKNIYFPNYRRFQDAVFFVNAMISCKKFYAIPLWVYAYRKNHKIVIWNTLNLCDHLTGICDILKTSKKNRLIKLHCTMIKNFHITITKRIRTINIYIVKKVLKVLLNIDYVIYIKYILKKIRHLLNKCLMGGRNVKK